MSRVKVPLTKEQFAEVRRKAAKNNHGTKGHSVPMHHTTDPHTHYQRALKTIRAYMAIDPKLRIANRKGAQKRAKNTVSKSDARPEDQDARSRPQDL